MKLIAKKLCSFGGRKFFIGDEIPADLVMNPKEQEKMDVLSIVSEDDHPGSNGGTVSVKVPVEEGELILEITPDGLQSFVNSLIGTADEAKATIDEMTDGDALILLHMTDTRKSVKVAAETRAKALNGQESAGEQ